MTTKRKILYNIRCVFWKYKTHDDIHGISYPVQIGGKQMDNELETKEAVSENTVTAQENAVPSMPLPPGVWR